MKWSRFYHRRQSLEAPHETVAQTRLFPTTPAKLITRAMRFFLGGHTRVMCEHRFQPGKRACGTLRMITETLP